MDIVSTILTTYCNLVNMLKKIVINFFFPISLQ